MSVANVSNDIIVEVSSAQEDIISKTQNRKNKRNKRELKLGTWNLQGTGQSLKLEHLVSDLKRYNVDICIYVLESLRLITKSLEITICYS
jgi:hypothetical protein